MEEEIKGGEVIKGPWKNNHGRNVKLPDPAQAETEMKIEFSEDLTQELIVQMIQMCSDNGINVTNENFLHDIGIIIEFTKGMAYRGMDLPYKTHKFVDAFVKVIKDPDGNRHTEFDIQNLINYVELFKSDDEE